MNCNKVSFQELLDCFDNDLKNNLENNADNLEHIKTHDSESRGQEEAGRTRDEQVSYLHVAPL